MSERTMAEGIMMCIDASWRPNEARDWTRPELILAEYVGDLRQRIAALERERDALAAALLADPMVEADEDECQFFVHSPYCEGACDYGCRRNGARLVEMAQRALAARDLAQQEKGGREALEEMKEALRHKTILVNFKRALLLMDLEEFARTWTPRERRGGEAG